jgi:hypothetical protein
MAHGVHFIAAMQPSRNRFEGNLAVTEFQRVLDECHRKLITGTIQIHSGDWNGTVELRAGTMMNADFGGLFDQDALEVLKDLDVGTFEVVQRLPDPEGQLASAAACHGDLAVTPLITLMRYCEEHALSCSIDIFSDELRGTLVYEAGDLRSVSINGEPDEDRIVELTDLDHGRFDVTVPRLDLALPGRPRFARASTASFGFGVDDHDDEMRGLLDAARESLTGSGTTSSERDEAPRPQSQAESVAAHEQAPPTDARPRRRPTGLRRVFLRSSSAAVRAVERSLHAAETTIARTRRALRRYVD